MRKTAAILLLTLLIFNTVGYKWWFNFEMRSADTRLEAALDKNNFNGQELFTLKIPINLPYQNATSSFERVDGEITVNGVTYKYVQRKITNDTLVLQCIRHTEKINLQQQSNDYFSKINDVAGNNDVKKMPGKNNAIGKLSQLEFTNDINLWKCAPFISTACVYVIKPFANNSTKHLSKLIKPPQTV